MKPDFLTASSIKKMIPSRTRDSHKGKNGHVLIVAGSRGMSGAAVLSALGALRIGAGLVTVAMPESERAVLTRIVPEALSLPLPESSKGAVAAGSLNIVNSYIERRRINAAAVGPGLSVAPAIGALIKKILRTWKLPLVLDADGLNNVAASDLKGYPALIITPHPVELSRLIKEDPRVVQADRSGVAENTARKYGLTCVLKGFQTVISDKTRTRINPTGTPAMATGGMGDVLTGMIAGLLAQGLKPWEAACSGVYLHGLAGELAAVADRGILARDVAAAVPQALRRIGKTL
jgi:NAD(P)H-hydrate epimerase